MKGVVDSEDIPLNLSRELLQDSNLIRRLRNILTQKIIRLLNDESKLEWQIYYIKQGLTFKKNYDIRPICMVPKNTLKFS